MFAASTHVSARRVALGLALAPVIGLWPSSPISNASAGQVLRLYRFSIPAAPLARALEVYAQQTGVQILYDAPIDARLRSPGVEGLMSAREALDRLLVGTGLLATRAGNDAVVLVRIPSANVTGNAAPDLPAEPGATTRTDMASGVVLVLDTVHVNVPPRRVPQVSDRYYGLLIQAAISAALKRDERTRGQRYTIRLRLWIDRSGQIVRSAIISSTGKTSLDKAINLIVEGVTLTTPPPDGLSQPVQLKVEAT